MKIKFFRKKKFFSTKTQNFVEKKIFFEKFFKTQKKRYKVEKSCENKFFRTKS